MRESTFKRGIHPPGGKEPTRSKRTVVLVPKEGEEMVFPLIQHLGAPCEPLVSKGDYVLLGQKIADSKAFVSAPIHSSVSGLVKEIRKVVTPTGVTCDAIVVEHDGKENAVVEKDHYSDYLTYPKEKYIEMIREAGIVGLGGAGFPTHIKLNPPPDKKIDYIIVNAAECEPYLTTDHRVMLEETERLIRGLRVILKIHPSAKGIIGIETNKPDAAAKLIETIKPEDNIEVVGLKPKYPQGSEKQLIYACVGREVPSGKLPADVGCIVNNVDTVIAIDRAVVRELPLMRKIVTVTGDAVKNPGNFKVRLGMSYKDVIEMAGGFSKTPAKLISGGPMMGVSMYSLDVPVIKVSSGIICLSKKAAYIPPEKTCIRCGKCIAYCPMNLMPLELNRVILAGDVASFEKNNGLDCIECGSCSYVCPAKRHLAQSIRSVRRSVMASRKR